MHCRNNNEGIATVLAACAALWAINFGLSSLLRQTLVLALGCSGVGWAFSGCELDWHLMFVM